MKALRYLPIALLGLLLAGCALFPHEHNKLAGTWTNSLGTVWMIHPDGTFDVDLDHNGSRDAWGKYTVEGDTVTLADAGGVVPTGCKGKGVYHFSRSGDTLQFALVHDKCKLRVKNVLLGWHSK
ncbi:MAG: hypothetical protein QOD99_1343 [Chthoniobacter sp.]|jgi:hypothetical protein|nr:hypothetical protein [Chthoniobacter sp.]